MEYDCDIVVIGGGAGGGTLASACAVSGKRVLLIERANRQPAELTTPGPPTELDERATLLEKRPYDDRRIDLNGQSSRLYMGGLLGGGTSVYGAALLRPQAADFSPGRYYGQRIPREIRDWPVQYETFVPFFRAAERLYRVADATPGPESQSLPRIAEDLALPESAETSEFPGLPLAEINSRLMTSARKASLNPWRLPLAIESSRCLRCDHCAGFVCPTGARRSSAQLVHESIARGEPLTLMQGFEAERLERGTNGKLRGVWVRNRTDGAMNLIRAKRYALSAGAIGSPALLLKSGFDHPQIGRNYMMHYSPLAIGLFARSTGSHQTFVKQVGLSDFYFGTASLPEKMGIIQSLPAPGPLMMAKSGMRHVPRLMLNLLRSRMLPLVGIVEDLPNPENRVSVSSTGTIQLHHEYSDYDRVRGDELARQMSRLLKSTGAFWSVTSRIPSREHVAHQCGTLRFGTSSDHAVADPECRLFDQPDVFVADGSFLPNSLGVGPSLTIIANALRVAGILVAEV